MAVGKDPAKAAFAALFLAAAGNAAAVELTGYGVLTTDYVFRGVSYSDSHGAVQGAVDAAFESGVYLGTWVSSVDIANGATHERDLQANYYLGYSREWNDDWILGANVVAYTFPGTRGGVDYDYTEYSLVANYRDRAWLEYSWSPDLFHSGLATHNFELYAEWPLPGNVLLGGGAGYYDTGRLTGVGYGYWQLGITRQFGPLHLDLRYHEANRPVPIISRYTTANARLVLSAKIPF